MLPEERQKRIFTMIQKKGSISCKDVEKALNISLPTVWRDLNVLEQQGKVSKTHGGAVLKEGNGYEFLFSNRLKKNIEVKKRIAEKAASLIESDEIIGLDTGTTAALAARSLRNHSNITVITPSLSAASDLLGAKGIYTILLGGNIREETMSVVGSVTVDHIRQFRLSKYFIGASAVDPVNGTMDAYLFEIEIKKAMMAVADKKIVLVDSTKFNKKSLAVMAEFKDVDLLITDKKITVEHERMIKEQSVEIIKV